jgi:AraC-like DNA-binding protein
VPLECRERFFSQRMSQILSMSPMEYVTHWRLESAHKALSDRHGSVPEIAESLGYQSVAAFSRAFKKQFGRGPGEVRRGR